MYITKVYLKNVRCFNEVTIDLTSNPGVKDWLLLLGDNGVGKTAILRSIAMGLCYSTSASGLLQELYGEWIRKDQKEGIIRIDLKSPKKNQKKAWIETIIKKDPSGYNEVTQKTSRNFQWDDIFICGYGAARRAFGTNAFEEYASVDSVYSLFNYNAPLQNPELILRRLEANKVNISRFLKKIDEILMLKPGSTQLTNTGISVGGPWGKEMTLGSLGDGYQGTLAWIIDLIGWALFFDPYMVNNRISGIILIDELEQHLHPKWQRAIVKLLRKQFPGLQFIASTHSPLCAGGISDLKENDRKILLESSPKLVEILHGSEVHATPPSLARACQCSSLGAVPRGVWGGVGTL